MTDLSDEKLDGATRRKVGEDTGETKKVLNDPEVDETTAKPTLRAISSAKQAWEIAKSLKDQGKQTRVPRNAEIAAKYNGESPYEQKKLVDIGEDWRNNATTMFLPSIVDRVKPQFPDALQRAKYLTNSKLPTLIPDSENKSKKFREIVTKTIRSWPQWQDFIALLSQEEVLIGYAAAIHLDPNDWRPTLFRNDEVFFPEGTGQNAKRVQVFVVEQELLIHEFCELFENQKAAKTNGYNIENCIEVANREIEAKDESELAKVDQVRENFFADSFNAKQKTITLFHVVVREYSGGVDLWTVDAKEGTEIRSKEKLYENSMEEACTLFTMQTGNGKYYGSKGLGRLLLNLHIAIERGRNLAMDQVYLSGLVILQVDDKDRNSVQVIVRHPFVVLPKAVNVSKETIQFDAEGYIAMDQKLVEIAESIAGSFVPPQIQGAGSSKTKIEAAQKVEREERVKQGVLQRFNNHAADLIGTMQGKICSAINLREADRVYVDRKLKRQGGFMVAAKKVMDLLKKAFSSKKRELMAVEAYESKIADCEAVECIVEILEAGLLIEEIAMLATSPTSDNLAGENQEADTNTIQFLAAQQQAGNQYINLKEATKVVGEILMGQDRLDRVLVPDEDQTVLAEASRMQITEFHDILDGEKVPVSPRDNHLVHRQVLYPKMTPILQALVTPGLLTPKLLTTAKNLLEHAHQHAEMDPEMKRDPKKAQAEQQALGMFDKVVAQAEKMLTQQQAQLAGQSPENRPPPLNSGQPQAGANGGQEGPSKLDHLTAAGDLAVRMAELETRKEELTHKKGMDRAKLVMDTHKLSGEQQDRQQSAIQHQVDTQVQLNEAAITAEAVRQKGEAEEIARQDKQKELNKVSE